MQGETSQNHRTFSVKVTRPSVSRRRDESKSHQIPRLRIKTKAQKKEGFCTAGAGDQRRTPPLYRACARIQRRAKVGVSRARQSRRRGSPQPAHELWRSFWAPELQQQKDRPRGLLELPRRDERKCKKLIDVLDGIDGAWFTPLNNNILLGEYNVQQSLRSGAGPFSSVRGA